MKESDFLAIKGATEQLVRRNKSLFNVSQYPLFDKELAADFLGDESNVKTVFEMFYMGIADDVNNIKEAYKNRDWIKIQNLAEKMMESASFGTLRLCISFLLLDGYLTLGYSTSKDALYTQAMAVLDETLTELEVNKPFMEEAMNLVSKN